MSNGNKGNRMKAMYNIKLPKSGDTHEELNAENVNQERLNENFSTLSKEVVKLWDNSDKGFDSLSARLTSDEEVFITADDAEDIAVYEIENSAVIAALPTEILTQVSRTYETKTDAADKLDAAKDYTDSELVDYSTTSQTADMISQSVAHKVGDDEIISKINQSAEQISIQANKVNLTGYVTATDLSTSGSTVINGANIATGSVALSTLTAAAQGGLVAGSSTKTQYYLSTSSSSATGGSWSDTVPTWSSGKYVWTREATTVTFASGGTSTGYSTAVYDSNLTTALSTAASASSAASTAQTTANGANAQEQLIYISKASGTTSVSANTTWVNDTSGSQNTWTLKRPVYNSSYPVLFIATQRKTVGGTVTCTTPMIDQTTTVIDGGHITTGTIDASVVSVTNLNASNITTGTMSADKISGGTLTVGGQNNTNGVIIIKDSANAASGRIDNAGIAVGGTEPQQGHKLIANYKPLYANINDTTTGKPLYVLQAAVPGATDEYTRLKLYGYQSGSEVSSVSLNANPSSNGGYLELIGNGETTKLSAGGKLTGNLSITGVLDVVPRRCYATLSSKGWYRVMNVDVSNANVSKFSVGTIVDINIGSVYWYAANCTRKISLHGVFNAPVFLGEESVSKDLNLIDKIRYTYDASGNGHIDVHYDYSNQNDVWCSFLVHLPYMNKHWFVAENFTAVADSPSGETVLTEYTFAANTSGTSVPTAGTYASVNTGSYVYRQGNIVYGQISMLTNSVLSSGAWSNLANISAGFRPNTSFDSFLVNNANDTPIHLRISTSGTVNIYPTTNIATGVMLLACFTYHCS